jgi:hypothetical protein
MAAAREELGRLRGTVTAQAVEQADRVVAQRGHDLWSVPGAELVTVVVEHHVAHLLWGSGADEAPVRTILPRP